MYHRAWSRLHRWYSLRVAQIRSTPRAIQRLTMRGAGRGGSLSRRDQLWIGGAAQKVYFAST